MAEPLEDPVRERFCVAYVALEQLRPGAEGNGSAAYKEVKKSASLKTAQNQATTFLKREDVQNRIAVLMADAEGADHPVHASAFIDDLLLRTIRQAQANEDAATMLRAAELADRGRLGGARFVKETKNRKIDENPLSGKSPREVEAMKRQALAEFGIDPDEMEEFQRFRRARTLEAKAGLSEESDEAKPQ